MTEEEKSETRKAFEYAFCRGIGTVTMYEGMIDDEWENYLEKKKRMDEVQSEGRQKSKADS